MRIVFTGGGTGGHLSPIVAVARELRRIAEEERILDLELFYFGPEAAPPNFMREEDILFSRIVSGKMRRYFSFRNIFDFVKIIVGIGQALWKVFIVMPDVVFAKGGYGSFPTLLAARLYRIPVMVHESDAVPGLVNRWAGKWARRVAISFTNAARYFPPSRTALTGVPIRARILGGNEAEARETFSAFSDRPVLFVTGGSQGARVLNRTVAGILKSLVERYEVIHQSGKLDYEDLKLEAQTILEGGGGANYYHLVESLSESEMRSAYFLADLIISRAGATTIAEIAAWGKPAILVPLKNAAQDHQKKNAYEFASRGAAVVIEQDNLTPSVLIHEIERMMSDREFRQKLGIAAKAAARLDAAEVIAKEILTLGLH